MDVSQAIRLEKIDIVYECIESESVYYKMARYGLYKVVGLFGWADKNMY